MTAISQPLQALAKAENVRLGRAALKRGVGAMSKTAGCVRVSELLEDPPDVLRTLAVADLVCWIHRIGGSYGRSILRHADPLGPISEFKRVGDLSERQRYALADHLYEMSKAAGC